MPEPTPYYTNSYTPGSDYPDPRKRGLNWVAIGVMLALLVGVGLAGWFVYDNRDSFFPQAAAQPTTTPSRPAAVATSSPTPTAAASTAPTQAPASVGPSSKPPTVLIDKFVASMTAPDLAFHVDATAVGYFPQPQWEKKVVFSVDRAGEDYEGSFKGLAQANGAVRMIAKDNVQYAKIGGSPWIRGNKPPPPMDALNPFLAYVTASDIEDLGVETRAGQKAHHLRVGLPDSPTCGLTNSFADFWVRSNGEPIVGIFTFNCTNSSGHGKFEWSNFGDSIVIRSPANFVST
jgi:hypothetical protein